MAFNAISSWYAGKKAREHTRELAQLNHAQQARFESNREAMQFVQMKLSCFQQAQNQAFQAEENRLNRQHQAELETFRQQVQKELNERNLQFQAWRLEQEQALQKELAGYARETQLMIAEFQRETARQQPEVNKLFEAWPLRLVPLQILSHQTAQGNAPLKVVIAPPEIDFDKFGSANTNTPKLEKSLSEGLRQFFNQHYHPHHPERAIDFIGGAWDAKRFHGEASIKALFSMLKSEPLLVLESEIDGDYLNMRFAYWGSAQPQYAYVPVVSRFKFRELVYESAKERARQWKDKRDKLLALGKNPSEVNKRDTYNLAILEEEEQLAALGIDLSQAQLRYQLGTADFEVLNQFLLLNHQLVAGLVADTHHLLQHETKPALPQWLPELLAAGVQADTLQPFLDAYQQVLQTIGLEQPTWAADLALDLAKHLTHTEQRQWVEQALQASLLYWLRARGQATPKDLPVLTQALAEHLVVADQAYVEGVQTCLRYLELPELSATLQAEFGIRQRIELEAQRLQQLELKKREAEEAERKAKEEIARVAEAERLAREAWKPKWASSAEEDEYGRYADLSVQGVTQRFRWIEAGTFLMGSTDTEQDRSNDETLHQVTLTQGYWLADTACTQALWQTVMGSNPADFTDSLQNPVEQVSWEDVQEFIKKLNKRLQGVKARLPTEAEWEYACRAGTSTPFSFGANITPEQANYNGSLGKTVAVKSLPANPWGLYEMHGNVWEWCQDWYGAYPSGSASDPRGSGSGTGRVLRGGSWSNSGRYVRSAFRNSDASDNRNDDVGFRLALGH
jgi:formylglycine-generating enzyme required for sulfatase activity